jgi:hypothetical protein
MAAPRRLVILVAAVFCAPAAFSQTPPASADPTPVPTGERKALPPGEPGPPVAGGLVVFIDPVTGKIRQPDAAEIGRLLAVKRAKEPLVSAPLLMKTGPGGAVGVVLDSRYENFMVVTKKPDGGLAMECVTGGQRADEVIAAGRKPARRSAGKEAADAP